MARPPLIIDTPLGRLYCIDLGAGACMLMIEQDGSAVTFPVDSQEGKRIASYMRGANNPSGLMGRPQGGATISDEDMQEAVRLYTSPEADAAVNRMQYTADQLGLTLGQVNSRITKAKKQGIMTQRYDTKGNLISDSAK